MQSASDERLMQEYANGHPEAFEELYARYRKTLYAYFRRQVSDAATANDLYQGAWEKIIAGRGRYRPDAPFRAWIFRIAHNHLMDHFRRLRPTAPLEESGFMDTAPGPETQLDEAAQKTALRRAILELPSEQRDALLLRLEGEFSLQTIAELCEVGHETIKSRLRYATKHLKKVLMT